MTTKTTKQRGYGWTHEQQRERLIRAHRDGTPCWWCDKPMYRDKVRNWDGRALHGDHSLSVDHGGTKTDRLLHGTCNLSRGNGDRDHLRPAATETPPEPVPAQPSALGVRAMGWPERLSTTH